MSKAVIQLGYTTFVVETSVAIMIAEAFANGERYEMKGYGDSKTYHVWDSDDTSLTVEFISDHVYRLGKAAGAPEKT